MTIFTKPVSANKDAKVSQNQARNAHLTDVSFSQSLEPLILTPPVAAVHNQQAKKSQPKKLSATVTVGVYPAAAGKHTAPLKKSHFYGQLCLLTAALVALIVGLIGALHVAQRLRQPRYLRGACLLPPPKDIRLLEGVGGPFKDEDFVGGFRGLEPVQTPRVRQYIALVSR